MDLPILYGATPLGTGQNLSGRAGTIDRGAKTFFRKKGGADFFSKKKIGGRRLFFSKKIRGVKTFLLQNLKIQYFIFQKKSFLKISNSSMLGHVIRVCSKKRG